MSDGGAWTTRACLMGAAAIVLLVPEARAQTLSLGEAIERALAQAPELRAAAAGEEEAAADARLARSARLPELSVRTGPGYASGVPAPLLGELPAVFGVRLRESLFDSDARAGEAEARARTASAHGELARARVAVARATADAFGACLRDRAGLAVATARAGEMKRSRERAAALLSEGRASELQVEQAALDEAKAVQDVADWRSRRELDRLSLAALLGTEPKGLPELSADSLGDLGEPAEAEDLARARASDPELVALEASVHHLERAARLRKGWFQPVIQGEAQYSRLYKTTDWDAYYPRFQPDNWSVGASIAIPIYTGGRLQAEGARARAASDRASARRELRERELRLAVAQARAGFERARAATALAERAEAVARRALADGEALAAEGRLDPAEQARQQIAVLDAKQRTAEARYQLLTAKVALLALRGDLGSHPGGAPVAGEVVP